MASDNTANKRRAWLAEADGQTLTVLPCPSCPLPMAMDMAHALWAVDAGMIDGNRNLRFAQMSHTVPGADGGAEYALECNRCNEARGQALWTPDASVRTYTERSKDYGPNKDAQRVARDSRAALLAEGYDA